MLCAQFLLRKRYSNPEEVRPLPCRSWGCIYCAPMRRRQLMAEAGAGQPTSLLTLTVNTKTGESPAHRRDLLHEAWRNLVKRLHRQFQLAPERRWQLRATDRQADKEAQVRRITATTPAKEVTAVPYFAFLERTKRGEPHLHILLRLPFVPQDWISEQMADMIGSPIVWIEAIKGTKHAVHYVTKYITKAPAQWGTKKRYWRSRCWRVNKGDDSPNTFTKHRDVELVRERWADFTNWRTQQGWSTVRLDDGWFRFYRPGVHPDWATMLPGLVYKESKEGMPPPHPA